MSDEQRKSGWLTRWREKGELKRRQRPWSHSSLDGDSEEKLAQRHTSGGEKLAADDRRLHIKGGGGGFGG
jgi:hypothetical protein